MPASGTNSAGFEGIPLRPAAVEEIFGEVAVPAGPATGSQRTPSADRAADAGKADTDLRQVEFRRCYHILGATPKFEPHRDRKSECEF